MSYVFEPATSTTGAARDRLARGPAVVLASVAAAGIYIDRNYSPSLNFWLITTIVIAGGWFLIFGLSAFFRDDGRVSFESESRQANAFARLLSCLSAIVVLG